MTEERKSVMVGNSECCVDTLSEWLQQRIAVLERKTELDAPGDFDSYSARQRANELRIIWDKINDGRIQEIGKVKFKAEKKS